MAFAAQSAQKSLFASKRQAMAMRVSIWSISIMAWAVAGIFYANEFLSSPEPLMGSPSYVLWSAVAAFSAWLQAVIGFWLLVVRAHTPLTGLQAHPCVARGSCLPSASLTLFSGSLAQSVFWKNGHIGPKSLPIEALAIFKNSCVQHSLWHCGDESSHASLPPSALDVFHFSAMRRLLHNSGKCLLPKEALEFFSGSLMQQAMIAELESSFDLTPTSVAALPHDDSAAMARTKSITDRLGSFFGSHHSQLASLLSSAMQHHAAGPPHTSSSSTGTTGNNSLVQPFSPASRNEASESVDGSAAAGNDAANFNFAESWVKFTSSPILGTPLQPWGQPAFSAFSQQKVSLSGNSAATEEPEGSQSLEGLPVTSAIPTATARKEAVDKLASNSSSLAAAIAEAEQALFEDTDALPLKKKVSLKRMSSSVKEFAIKAFQGSSRG